MFRIQFTQSVTNKSHFIETERFYDRFDVINPIEIGLYHRKTVPIIIVDSETSCHLKQCLSPLNRWSKIAVEVD